MLSCTASSPPLQATFLLHRRAPARVEFGDGERLGRYLNILHGGSWWDGPGRCAHTTGGMLATAQKESGADNLLLDSSSLISDASRSLRRKR